jgi:N-acetylated-alpha-linked acidic dipeptidase
MTLLFAAAAAALAATEPSDQRSLAWFTPEQRAAQLELERSINAVPSPDRLRGWHDLLCTEPHQAGTEADERMIGTLAKAIGDLGLETVKHDIWVYLATPIDAALEIVESPEVDPGAANPASGDVARGASASRTAAEPAPGAPGATGATGATGTLAAPPRRGMRLGIQENRLLEDPYSQHPGLTYGWNAYSGSGDVTAEVVYANYGRKEDFERLRELGVEVNGKIVIARYGGNFRGYKVKFAQQAGAAGLIIYTDPDDSGYRKGLLYPEGGWANDTCIQRGSINTLPYIGDPLTPYVEATRDAERQDPATLDLPRIPVQPIGWQAAAEIMGRMRGASPALPEGWQGGLPFPYRVSGGPELKVRLMVRQMRNIARTSNVIGIIPGAVWPDEWVIAGCHFDAWTFGASDPHAGTIVLLEAARSFAEMARAGRRPARTIIFANWAAEEFGIIGSSEYCEGMRDELMRKAVAYINLDMAAMGPNFGSSSSPSLKTLIEDATRGVPRARAADGRSVYEAWSGGADREPSFGNLGGGSDHVGFYCHLGIPSCSIGASGSAGTAYHSNYDTLAWYRKVVGDDYEPALMLTRVLNVMLARLANSPAVPLDPARYAADARAHLAKIAERARALGVEPATPDLAGAIDAFERAAAEWAEPRGQGAAAEAGAGAGAGGGGVDSASAHAALLAVERAWFDGRGLPGRPWFRNLYASPDPESGYSEWMLPLLRGAVESIAAGGERGEADLARALAAYESVFQTMRERIEELRTAGGDQPTEARDEHGER